MFSNLDIQSEYDRATKEVSQPKKKNPRDDKQYIWDRKDNISMGWWPCDDEKG